MLFHFRKSIICHWKLYWKPCLWTRNWHDIWTKGNTFQKRQGQNSSDGSMGDTFKEEPGHQCHRAPYNYSLSEGLPPPCSSYSQSTGLCPLSSLRESFSNPSNVLILATLSNLYLSVGVGKTTVMWLGDIIFWPPHRSMLPLKL